MKLQHSYSRPELTTTAPATYDISLHYRVKHVILKAILMFPIGISLWKHLSLLTANPALEIEKQLFPSSLIYQVLSKTAIPALSSHKGHSCPTPNGTARPWDFAHYRPAFFSCNIFSHVPILVHVQASFALLPDGHPFLAGHTTTGNRYNPSWPKYFLEDILIILSLQCMLMLDAFII